MNDTDPASLPAAAPRKHHARWVVFAVAGITAALTYFAVSYLLMPLFWVSYAHIHPALDEVPGITYTGTDIPGDPLNVALIGYKEDVERAMKAAGWLPADALGLRSDAKIVADTVLRRPYAEAPVSSLYLYGRKEDLAFEQPVGHDPSKRHHVRFWKAPKPDAQGRALWIGSATYDKHVGLSGRTGQVTHRIDGDVDKERDHLLQTLKASGDVVSEQLVPNFHKVRTGKNGGGDVWTTDGSLGVATLVSTPASGWGDAQFRD